MQGDECEVTEHRWRNRRSGEIAFCRYAPKDLPDVELLTGPSFVRGVWVRHTDPRDSSTRHYTVAEFKERYTYVGPTE